MENRLSGLPPPHPTAAANVEQALQILHCGDSRVTQADQYLAQVRSAPTAWPIVRAIFHQQNTSYHALSFATNTIYHRIQADWLLFPTDHDRLIIYSLAIEAIYRLSMEVQQSIKKDSSLDSAIHFLGKSCGFALCMVNEISTRIQMWQQLIDTVNSNPILKCQILTAVAIEINLKATMDDLIHAHVREFCRERSIQVVQTAISILSNLNNLNPGTLLSSQTLHSVKAAILCCQAWQRYSQPYPMANALIRSMRLPQLATDSAETIAEFVAYSGTPLPLLIQVCDGLLAILHDTNNVDQQGTIHHAIAEVVCTLSDGNADELMEQTNDESQIIVAKVVDILWMCLKSCNHRSFYAAAEGWSNWLSAEAFVSEKHRKLPKTKLEAIPSFVTSRMTSLPFMEAMMEMDEGDDEQYAIERDCAMELLLHTAASIGITAYVKSILLIFDNQEEVSAVGTCAVLEGLAAASEHSESVVNDPEAQQILHLMLGKVMEKLEMIFNANANGMNDSIPMLVVRRSALKCLSAYAHILADSPSDDEFYRVVRSAGTGILQDVKNDRAACLLYELAERNPRRLVPYLPELVSSSKRNLRQMSTKAAEMCAKALSRISSALQTTEERLQVVRDILHDAVERITWLCNEKSVQQSSQLIHNDLQLISTAIHELNDGVAAMKIFEEIKEHIFKISTTYCSNEIVAGAMSRLLMVCVIPTLSDDEESTDIAVSEEGMTIATGNMSSSFQISNDQRKRKGHQEGLWTERRRLAITLSCYTLAAECFVHSGPDGETCWLTAMLELLPHMNAGVEVMPQSTEWKELVNCLSKGMKDSIEGIGTFCADHDYDAQPEMMKTFLKHAKLVLCQCWALAEAGGGMDARIPITMHASGLGHIIGIALKCDDTGVVREAVGFWVKLFGIGTPSDIARTLLHFAGGTRGLTEGMLLATRAPKCTSEIAAAMFAMCKMLTGDDGDYGNVLRGFLQEGFTSGPFAKARLDEQVRDRLQQSCYEGVNSLWTFRKALCEYGQAFRIAVQHGLQTK